MPMTEQQLSALIDAAVREAVERTAQQLTAKHEAETAGLRRNRDDLLAEKKEGAGKKGQASSDGFDEWLAGVDERLTKLKAESARLAGKVDGPAVSPVREHTITREEARSGQAYREAKAAAEKAGVPLRIIDERAPVTQAGRRSSPVKYCEDQDAGLLYANAELVSRHGIQRMKALAAEKGRELRVFRSAEDLPQAMQQAHAQAIADRAPGTLLEGGE